VDELEALSEEVRIAYRTGSSQHPVIAAFIEVACHFRIPIEYPMDFLKGIIMDASHKRYRSFDDLYLFCYRVAGIVGLMMTHVLGYENRDAFPYAEKLGVAMQLTNILRDVQEDKDMGRIYIPQDELAIFEVPEADILNDVMSDRMRRLMAFQAQRAHDYFDEANQGIRLLHTESQFGIRCASRIYRGILHKLEANDYNPFRGRVWLSRPEKMRIIFAEYLNKQRNGHFSK
jgi:phytoene synthase